MKENFSRGGGMEEDWRRMEEDGGGLLERRGDGKWTNKKIVDHTYIYLNISLKNNVLRCKES